MRPTHATRFLTLAFPLLPVLAQESLRTGTTHIPLNFSGAQELEFPANDRMDLTRGTVEFYVAAGWKGTLGHEPCVLAYGRNRDSALHGSEKWDPGTRYAVHLGADGKSIGMWNGSGWSDVACEMTPGRYYHVALVTSGAHTAVLLDGECLGVLPLGYGTTSGSRLFVGSNGDLEDPLVGSLLYFRIWDLPLAAPQVRALAKVSDPPAELEITQHLVAASRFTADETAVDYFDYPGVKTEEVWRKLAPWTTSAETAREQAIQRGVPILSYAPAGAQSIASASVERWLLGSSLFLGLAQGYSLHLDERASASPGRFTILDAGFEPLASNVCVTVEDLLRMTSDASGFQNLRRQQADKPLSPDAAARMTALRARAWLARTTNPVAVPEGPDLHDEAFDMLTGLNQEIALRKFLHDYRTCDPLTQKVAAALDNSPEVQAEWRGRAFELQSGWLPPPPLDLDTYEFGFLVAEHLVDRGDFEGAEEWAQRVDPFRELDPVTGFRLEMIRRRMSQ